MEEAAPDRLKHKPMLIDSLPQATPEKKNMRAGRLLGNRGFDGRFRGACCILARYSIAGREPRQRSSLLPGYRR